MTVRRGALLLTVAAMATTVFSGATPTASAARTAPAQRSICVALVVDFGELGDGVKSTCATVRNGSTGYDVLSAGGHTFTICSNGVLGTIDGKPADGCTAKNDEKHYWSYWHRTPGSTRWTYSTEGGGTYEPANASTEGWRWMKSPPANVPYSRICTPSATPSPARSATPSPPATTAPSAGFSRAPRAPTPTATTEPTAAATAPAAATRSHDPRGRVQPTGAASPTRGAEPTPVAVSNKSTAKRGGPPYVLLATIVVIAVVGGAAGWRARRNRDIP